MRAVILNVGPVSLLGRVLLVREGLVLGLAVAVARNRGAERPACLVDASDDAAAQRWVRRKAAVESQEL